MAGDVGKCDVDVGATSSPNSAPRVFTAAVAAAAATDDEASVDVDGCCCRRFVEAAPFKVAVLMMVIEANSYCERWWFFKANN